MLQRENIVKLGILFVLGSWSTISSITFNEVLEDDGVGTYQKWLSEGHSSLERLSSFNWRDIDGFEAKLELMGFPKYDLPEYTYPLHIVSLGGRIDLAKEILAEKWACVLEKRDQYGNTALHYAIAGGSCPLVAFLCLRHANLREMNTFGISPFDMLSLTENADLLVLVSEMTGDEVPVCSDRRITFPEVLRSPDSILALRSWIHSGGACSGMLPTYDYHCLCAYENDMTWLGYEINPGPDRFRPLHLLALMGRSDLVQALLSYRIVHILFAKDDFGNNALHYAVAGGDLMCCMVLAGAGVSPWEENAESKSPIDIALERGRKRIARVIGPKYENFLKTNSKKPPCILL